MLSIVLVFVVVPFLVVEPLVAAGLTPGKHMGLIEFNTPTPKNVGVSYER